MVPLRQNQHNAIWDIKISINIKQQPIYRIIRWVEEKYGIELFATEEVALGLKREKVDIQAKDKPLKVFFRELLESNGYIFSFTGKTLLIKGKLLARGQQRVKDTVMTIPVVTGKVTDASGAPVAEATVIVEAMGKGDITDADGNFTLRGVKIGKTLEISSIGYERRRIPVTGAFIIVRLNLAVSGLDEIVVIAYGTTTGRLNTGNVASIKARDIEKQPVSNFLLAMQDRVPGVMIEQSTGLPGTGVKVRIQGANSLKQGNDPLYVIDGVPFPSYMLFTLSNILGAPAENAPEIAGAPAARWISLIPWILKA